MIALAGLAVVGVTLMTVWLFALALLLGVWLYSATFLNGRGNFRSELLSVIGFAITFATLPVVGLYFSLARASTIAALIWTISIQIAAPALLGEIAHLTAAARFSKPNSFYSIDWFVPLAVQMALALIFGWRLHADLKGRKFVLA